MREILLILCVLFLTPIPVLVLILIFLKRCDPENNKDGITAIKYTIGYILTIFLIILTKDLWY